ncbi:MAG: methyltransferase domain-containing protein [Alphaproteobacteria bacterium]|nr:methyltransferase domain-containing protein [Alphaproteobacteria bacterium]
MNDLVRNTSAPKDNSVNIFARHAVRQHRDRAAKVMRRHPEKQANFLFSEVADRLVDRLLDVQRSFELCLDLGCHNGEVQKWLENAPGKVEYVISTDMSEEYAKNLRLINAKNLPVFVSEEDLLPIRPESLDLVTSNLSLHWVNDLPGALAQIRQSLKPDGLFMGAMLGGESLYELRSALVEAEIEISGGLSPRISPFTDIRDLGSLMQRAGFALPVLDSEVITVTYDNLFKLAEDLRNMGETNAVHERIKHVSSREIFLKAAEKYAQNYTNEEGKITASFVVIYMHGWAPDASQQQPLKPGAGQASLAQFLKEDE